MDNKVQCRGITMEEVDTSEREIKSDEDENSAISEELEYLDTYTDLTSENEQKDIRQLGDKPKEKNVLVMAPTNENTEKQIAPTLRIVLLGKSDDKKAKALKIILSEERLNVKTKITPCQKISGKMNGQPVTVVSTPDLFSSNQSSLDFEQNIETCKSLVNPGPHVLLLMLKPQNFVETDKHRLESILRKFGPNAYHYLMVITTHKEEKDSDLVNEVIANCERQSFEMHKETNSHSLSLLTKNISEMVKNNDWQYLNYTEGLEPTKTPEALSVENVPLDTLNIVLCGRRGDDKTATANAMLGSTKSSPGYLSSAIPVKREGEACGHHLTLIEMPALYGTSEEVVMRETIRCISHCDPPGVHAFLLVVSDGQLTNEDKEELKIIQDVFSSSIDDFIMILYKQELVQTRYSSHQEIIKRRGIQHHVLSEPTKISTLIGALEKKTMERQQRCYTSQMFLQAYSKRQNIQNKELTGSVDGDNSLKIVLLGKTGVGKSATGNTILGKIVFKEDVSAKSVTSVCQKETVLVEGRQVTVIDTPGLFDTDIDADDLKKEICKSIIMASPGPHVFLLIVPVGRYTEEEWNAVKVFQEIFGEKASEYTVVLFAKGDALRGKSIEDFVEDAGRDMQHKLEKCGNRFQAFNNLDEENKKSQVLELLKTVDNMVATNGGGCYTTDMFQEVEWAIKKEQERILEEKKEEMEREKEELRRKHEEELLKIQTTFENERARERSETEKREEEFKKREEEISMLRDENKVMEKSLKEELEEQRAGHKKEMERERQIQEKNISLQQELQILNYEKEKESLRMKTEKEARDKAEIEFSARLEKEMTQAKTEGCKEGKGLGYKEGEEKGIEVGKKEALSNLSNAAKLAEEWGNVNGDRHFFKSLAGAVVGAYRDYRK